MTELRIRLHPITLNYMVDTGVRGVRRAINSLLYHGWRVLTEVHTVVWIVTDLLGIAVGPTALGLWMRIQGVHLSIVIAVATLVLGVCFLCLLGLLGYKDEQRLIRSAPPRHASPQPATPIVSDHPATKEADPEERIFLGEGITPKYLLAFFEHHTAVQATNATKDYIGKWMKVAGPIRNVLSTTESLAQVTFERPPASWPHEWFDYIDVYMYFRGPWMDRARILVKGENITVIGQISEIRPLMLQWIIVKSTTTAPRGDVQNSSTSRQFSGAFRFTMGRWC